VGYLSTLGEIGERLTPRERKWERKLWSKILKLLHLDNILFCTDLLFKQGINEFSGIEIP
jgi:hypothetical protein